MLRRGGLENEGLSKKLPATIMPSSERRKPFPPSRIGDKIKVSPIINTKLQEFLVEQLATEKNIQIGQKEIKLPLFANDTLSHTENPKD